MNPNEFFSNSAGPSTTEASDKEPSFTELSGIEKGVSSLSSQLSQLFKEQHILMMLLKEFRDGILICDPEGRILHVNRSLKNFLSIGNEVLGKQVTDVIRNDTFPKLLETVLETGTSCVEEIMLSKGLNQDMFFEAHLVPLSLNLSGPVLPPLLSGAAPNPDIPNTDTTETCLEASLESGINGCIIIFHNITDIRQTERMRRDFVANVSHELRTPLSAIEGYAETLLEGALDDSIVCRDFIQVIHRHSLRLTQLVGDLLDLSKLESPDYKLEFMPVSLPHLVQQVLTLVEDKAIDKGIEIDVEIPDSLPAVKADFSSLQQVLTNLLDNAIKYTPKRGSVSVQAFETQRQGLGFIQVNVTDNGLGIETKHLTRIFERFYRVDKARSRDLGGTGLGLSIVKHIVQLHGGEIWVDSQVNHGSTFSFTLAL